MPHDDALDCPQHRLTHFKAAAIAAVYKRNADSLFPLPASLDGADAEPPHSRKASEYLQAIGFPEQRVYLVEVLRVLSELAPPQSLVEAWFGDDDSQLLAQICFPEKPLEADPMDHFLAEVEQYSKASAEAQTLASAYLLALFEVDGVVPIIAEWWERPVLAMTRADPRLRQPLLMLLGLDGVDVARPWER